MKSKFLAGSVIVLPFSLGTVPFVWYVGHIIFKSTLPLYAWQNLLSGFFFSLVGGIIYIFRETWEGWLAREEAMIKSVRLLFTILLFVALLAIWPLWVFQSAREALSAHPNANWLITAVVCLAEVLGGVLLLFWPIF